MEDGVENNGVCGVCEWPIVSQLLIMIRLRELTRSGCSGFGDLQQWLTCCSTLSYHHIAAKPKSTRESTGIQIAPCADR